MAEQGKQPTVTTELDSQTRDVISMVRTRLIVQYPFFGVLSLNLRLVGTTEVETAATDGKHLFVNPAFIKKLEHSDLKFVICHEVLHCALAHAMREGRREHVRWNYACDYAVNALLKNGPADLWRNVPQWVLYDQKFENMTAEEIYEKIPTPKKIEIPIDLIMPGFGSSDSDGGNSQEGKSKGSTEKLKDFLEKNGMTVSEQEAKQLQEEWKGYVASALQYGNLPGSLERAFKDILYPKLSWRQILEEYISALALGDYDWMRPDKRYIEKGLYLPGMEYEQRMSAVIAIDTSGSISDEQLEQFVSECQTILSQRGVSEVWLISCDASIHYVGQLNSGDVVPSNAFKGRGGTDFRPPFSEVDKRGLTPDIFIYFTDAYGPFPSREPGYPVIWVVDTDQQVPFGRRIQL